MWSLSLPVLRWLAMSASVTYLPESPQILLRLLEGHAAICVKLSEDCAHARTKQLLRQLAADLLIEAESQRAVTKSRKASITGNDPI
jgi:hypothetical protein